MRILLSGGTGLIGSAVTAKLQDAGHEVVHLSRNPRKNAQPPQFGWNVEKGEIDPAALENCEVIINLAGAPIAERWTPEHKSEILRSRVDGTRLLFNAVREHQPPLKTFISASAVGFYRNDYQREHREDDPPGDDFLSLVCQKWESEARNFEELDIRTLRVRIGIVLSEKGGALPQMAKPVKFGVGAPLGNGKQLMPWIHLEDLARQFVFLLENENLSGAINGVGPKSLSNKELTRAIARVLNKPLWLPNVPAGALRLMLGEMAKAALASNGASSQKIESAGFRYRFAEIDPALKDLLL